MLFLMDRLNLFLNNNNNRGVNYDIALYVKNHFEEVLPMTIDALADACHVSRATISRFSRAMGYDNFIHFKDECRRYYTRRPEVTTQEHVGLAYNPETFSQDIDKAIINISEGLRIAHLHWDNALVDRLVHDLIHYNRIYILGMSYSHLIAEQLQIELSYLGKQVQLLSESADLEKLSAFTKNDMALVISMYNNFFSLDYRLAEEIKSSGCRSWLITAMPVDKSYAGYFDDTIFVYDTHDLLVNRYVLQFFVDVLLSRYEYFGEQLS